MSNGETAWRGLRERKREKQNCARTNFVRFSLKFIFIYHFYVLNHFVYYSLYTFGSVVCVYVCVYLVVISTGPQ